MNNTLALVEKEIEKFLADFPDDHPYQRAMSLPYFRQILETKIAREVLNHERVILEESIESRSPELALKLLVERLFIEEEICFMMPNIVQNVHMEAMMAHPFPLSYHLVTDLQGIIQNISFNVCQLFNLKRKEIIGQSLLFFVPQWQWKKFYYYLEKMKQDTSNEEITEVWSIQLETSQPETSKSKLMEVGIETSIHRDSQGNIIGWYWLLQELSQPHLNHSQTFQEVSAINRETRRAEAIAPS